MDRRLVEREVVVVVTVTAELLAVVRAQEQHRAVRESGLVEPAEQRAHQRVDLHQSLGIDEQVRAMVVGIGRQRVEHVGVEIHEMDPRHPRVPGRERIEERDRRFDRAQTIAVAEPVDRRPAPRRRREPWVVHESARLVSGRAHAGRQEA